MNQIIIDSTDIHEHLPTLSALSGECNHITEMGVRYGCSTIAFINGLPKGGTLISIDIVDPPMQNLRAIEDLADSKGLNFLFVLGDTLKITIDETDMLFIDTLHTGKQLTRELIMHSDKARKYIVLHDTVSCKDELWPVVEKFVGLKWKIKHHYENNNGLLVMERI